MLLTRLIPGFAFVLSLAAFFGINGKSASSVDPFLDLDVDFEAVSKTNSAVKNSLRWSFGGKPQKGWYLYVALIKKAMDTDQDENSVEFAREVYQWQEKKHLRATGVLDRDTLLSFIRYWQSKRIRPITLAREEQLISAPIVAFYDPTRQRDLLKLDNSTFKAYKALVAAAIKDESLSLDTKPDGSLSGDEEFLKIISSYRSPEYQAGLRKREPNAGRAQIAFRSPHFTGRALDIYVGGEPVSTKDYNRALQVNTPVYIWLVRNAEKYGFYPYFYEPWHWEYVPENKGG